MIGRERWIPWIDSGRGVDTLLDGAERRAELNLILPQRLDGEGGRTGAAIPPEGENDFQGLGIILFAQQHGLVTESGWIATDKRVR